MIASCCRYKKLMLRWYLAEYNKSLVPGSGIDLTKVMPTQKQAVIWAYQVWQDMPDSIFFNCWKKAGGCTVWQSCSAAMPCLCAEL